MDDDHAQKNARSSPQIELRPETYEFMGARTAVGDGLFGFGGGAAGVAILSVVFFRSHDLTRGRLRASRDGGGCQVGRVFARQRLGSVVAGETSEKFDPGAICLPS